MSDTPDRPTSSSPDPSEEVEADETINPESEVDEALYETFPASDAPGYTEGTVSAEDYDAQGEEE